MPTRRQHNVLALIVTVMLVGGTPSLAARDTVVGGPTEILAPVTSPHGIVAVPSARALGHGIVHAQAFVAWRRDVGRVFGADADPTVGTADELFAELAIAVGLFDRLDLALALPLHTVQLARGAAGEPDLQASGLGDLRFVPKVTILGGVEGFGLAAQAELTVPTARSAPATGERGVTVTPSLVADVRFPHGVLALLVGYRVRPATSSGGVSIDDELRLGLGGELDLGHAGLSLLAEVDAALGFGGSLGSEEQSPVEILAALRWRHPDGLALTLGGGVGATDGYGAPDARVLLTVAVGPEAASPWAPASAAAVAGSGPAGESPPATDAPPADAPLPVLSTLATPAAFDAAVADDPDRDGDGIVAESDGCPDAAEDRDGFEDEDGCPEPDNDRDGVPDGADRCPGEPESLNGVEDADGCPDVGGSRAVFLGEGRIEITERVHFETGSDVLRPDSHAILRQVASFLKAHWAIRKVRIEGHTDDQGDREMNVDLSERRARRVMEFLVEEGVEPWRLDAKGFGTTRPIQPGKGARARAANRRVEFRVMDLLGPGGAP